MDEMKLDRLIVENITDIDATSRRAVEIGEMVDGEICEVARKWASDNGFVANAEDDTLWLSHPDWKTEDGDEDQYDYWFGFQYSSEYLSDSVEDQFMLTSLCKAGTDSMGFRLIQEVHAKRPWKKFLQSSGENFSGTRFVIDDVPTIWLPVVVDRTLLATAVEEEQFEEALKPVIDALDEIKLRFELLNRILATVPE